MSETIIVLLNLSFPSKNNTQKTVICKTQRLSKFYTVQIFSMQHYASAVYAMAWCSPVEHKLILYCNWKYHHHGLHSL